MRPELGMKINLPAGHFLHTRLLPALGNDVVALKINVQPTQPQDLTPAHTAVGGEGMQQERYWLCGSLAHGGQKASDLVRAEIKALPQIQHVLLAQSIALDD